MSVTHLAIAGVAGRMGRRLVALASPNEELLVAHALVRPGHPDLGRDAGELANVGLLGVSVTDALDVDRPVHVLIDFTSPPGMRHWLRVCRHRRVAMLTGTTGLTPEDHRLIDEAALEIPVLQATNTSLGVAVLNRLAAEAARLLGPDYDVEVVEAHHRHKRDAPSGTAATLAGRICAASGRPPDAVVFGRHGPDVPRQPGQVGVHSLRMGDVVGQHTAHFATDGERLEVTHAATSRDVFVRGALRAAQWLAGRGAGRYQIEDVLGIAR